MVAKHPNTDISKHDWIEDRVLRFLMRNALASILSSLMVIVVYAWANWHLILNSVWCQVWLVTGIVLSITRVTHALLYDRKHSLLPNVKWLNSYRLLTLCSGLIYGSMTILFFEKASTSLQVLNMFVAVGMPSAAVGTHAADRVTYRSFMLTIVVPAAIVLYLTNDPTYRVVSFLMIVFAIVMDRSAGQAARSLMENIELTYEMSYRATHDSLVGLYNREELEHQFEVRSVRSNRAIAMLFVDLDNFKPLNDTLGHQAGDLALTKVADIIKNGIRTDDIAARLGGDEFVVVLFLDQVSEAQSIAQHILDNIAGIPFEGGYDGLSASIGISYHVNSKVGFSRLMRLADMACYQSKEMGKNRVTLIHYALDDSGR